MIQFRPNHQKILETILWLASAKPGIDKYALLKLMFLADKAHVNKFARPASSDNYVAMSYGPVPTEAYRILNEERPALNALKLKKLPFHLEPNAQGQAVIVVAERAPNTKVLSKSDIAVMIDTLDRYGGWSFNRLKDFTHADPAYKVAWANRGDKKSVPIDYALLLTNERATDSAKEELAYIAKHAMV